MIKLLLTSEELMALFGHLERRYHRSPSQIKAGTPEGDLSSVHQKVKTFVGHAIERFDEEDVEVASGIGPNDPEFVPAAKRFQQQEQEKIDRLTREVQEIAEAPENFLTDDEHSIQHQQYPKRGSHFRDRKRRNKR